MKLKLTSGLDSYETENMTGSKKIDISPAITLIRHVSFTNSKLILLSTKLKSLISLSKLNFWK